MPSGDAGTFRGKSAVDRLVATTKRSERVRTLASSVHGFFGDGFRLQESPDFKSSRYDVYLDHESLTFSYALLKLRTGSGREEAAAIHELLHLDEIAQGLPFGDRYDLPDELVQFEPRFEELRENITNALGHELTFPRFKALGLAPRSFLTPLVPRRQEDYESILEDSKTDPEQVVRAFWSWESLGFWMSARQGGSGDLRRHADDVAQWGRGVCPRLDATLMDAKASVEAHTPLQREAYPKVANQLLTILGAQPFNRWLVLSRTNGGTVVPTVFAE